MDKKEIVAKLTKMRQQYILNRSKKREEKKFKEETSQPLLSFQRKGNNLIVSGDSYSVRKINEAGPILEYLEEILLLNEASEEGRRYVCQGEENNEEFIPKLFCQVGDRKSKAIRSICRAKPLRILREEMENSDRGGD